MLILLLDIVIRNYQISPDEEHEPFDKQPDSKSIRISLSLNRPNDRIPGPIVPSMNGEFPETETPHTAAIIRALEDQHTLTVTSVGPFKSQMDEWIPFWICQN
jgi:hypothetical protein